MSLSEDILDNASPASFHLKVGLVRAHPAACRSTPRCSELHDCTSSSTPSPSTSKQYRRHKFVQQRGDVLSLEHMPFPATPLASITAKTCSIAMSDRHDAFKLNCVPTATPPLERRIDSLEQVKLFLFPAVGVCYTCMSCLARWLKAVHRMRYRLTRLTWQAGS